MRRTIAITFGSLAIGVIAITAVASWQAAFDDAFFASRESSPAPAYWTPSNATVEVRCWLDCADTARVTVASGRVSAFADKSGFSNNAAQATVNYRPAWGTNGPGNEYAMTFDGSNDRLEIADHASLQFSTSNFAVWVVGTFASSSVWCEVISKDYFGFEIFSADGTTNWSSRIASYMGGAVAATQQAWKLNGYVTNQWGLLSLQRQGASHQQVYVDGVAGEKSATNLSSVSRVGKDINIGKRTGATPGDPFKGSIAEVVVTFGSFAEGEREKFEGYLAHKWGLEANLPAEHPYKEAWPTQ